MTNEIAKIENFDAIDAAIGNEGDEPLRFKDGAFNRGFDKLEVPLKTRLMMHPASWSDGFIKWEDGKPVEWRIREVNNPAQLPIFRDALGDDDESQWPDGKDPWRGCAGFGGRHLIRTRLHRRRFRGCTALRHTSDCHCNGEETAGGEPP